MAPLPQAFLNKMPLQSGDTPTIPSSTKLIGQIAGLCKQMNCSDARAGSENWIDSTRRTNFQARRGPASADTLRPDALGFTDRLKGSDSSAALSGRE